MGDKIPESQRPDVKKLYDTLDLHVSKTLQDIFVVDAQNDCACSVELYDSSLNFESYHLSESGIQHHHSSENLALPILPNINSASILELISFATKKAGGNLLNDVVYSGMIYNPASNLELVSKTFEHYIGKIISDHRGGNYRWLSLETVPLDRIYLIPDSEFFGVIAINLGGIGAFCINSNIWEVLLDT